MRWFYTPGYDYGRWVPGLPRQIHGFVRDKATRIRDALVAAGVAHRGDFERPEPVSRALLESVHTSAVLDALGTPSAIARAVELAPLAFAPLPLVRHMVVTPQMLAAGGTCAAMRAAVLGSGWCANLSGGFHHARPDLSHGFCLINDVALGVEALRAEGHRPRVLVLDLDLHQGDGNSAAFASDPEVFTVSLHEAGAFPHPKVPGDLDVGLPAHTGDRAYLDHLEGVLATIQGRFSPTLIVYVAGSDPFEGDPLGTLRLSPTAMMVRDQRVASFARAQGCPLVLLTAGGYSEQSPEITARGFAAIQALEPGTGDLRGEASVPRL